MTTKRSKFLDYEVSAVCIVKHPNSNPNLLQIDCQHLRSFEIGKKNSYSTHTAAYHSKKKLNTYSLLSFKANAYAIDL